MSRAERMSSRLTANVRSKVVTAEEADKMKITTTSLKQELKLRKIGARAAQLGLEV